MPPETGLQTEHRTTLMWEGSEKIFSHIRYDPMAPELKGVSTARQLFNAFESRQKIFYDIGFILKRTELKNLKNISLQLKSDIINKKEAFKEKIKNEFDPTTANKYEEKVKKKKKFSSFKEILKKHDNFKRNLLKKAIPPALVEKMALRKTYSSARADVLDALFARLAPKTMEKYLKLHQGMINIVFDNIHLVSHILTEKFEKKEMPEKEFERLKEAVEQTKEWAKKYIETKYSDKNILNKLVGPWIEWLAYLLIASIIEELLKEKDEEGVDISKDPDSKELIDILKTTIENVEIKENESGPGKNVSPKTVLVLFDYIMESKAKPLGPRKMEPWISPGIQSFTRGSEDFFYRRISSVLERAAPTTNLSEATFDKEIVLEHPPLDIAHKATALEEKTDKVGGDAIQGTKRTSSLDLEGKVRVLLRELKAATTKEGQNQILSHLKYIFYEYGMAKIKDHDKMKSFEEELDTWYKKIEEIKYKLEGNQIIDKMDDLEKIGQKYSISMEEFLDSL